MPTVHRPGAAGRLLAVLAIAAAATAIIAARTGPAADPPPPSPVVTAPASPPPAPAANPPGAPASPPVPASPAPTPPGGPMTAPQNPPAPPAPGPAVPPATPGTAGTNPPGSDGSDTPSTASDPACGVHNISACVSHAIDGFFQRVVDSALNPLLDLLSHTLLTTPDPLALPRVAQLWSNSWQLVIALYGLVVTAAGILVMVHETVQERWSVRELAPRLVGGFLAGGLSMVIATQAIRFANALARAVAGDGVDSHSAVAALHELTTRAPATGGIFLNLLQLALVVMLVVLIVAYVIRVAVTVILVVAAPLALMCHALPGVDTVARWWWRAFAACLGIQIVQSLILVTSLRVFLTPGGWELFGPNATGIVNLIIAIALMGVLTKTPFWLLSTLRIGPGRSMISSLARGYLGYKTMGLLKGGRKTTTVPRDRPTPATIAALAAGKAAAVVPKPAPNPYQRSPRATREGQLLLPFDGIRRMRPASEPGRSASKVPAPQSPTPPPNAKRSRSGEQLRLPLPQFHDIDLGPQPRLGRDGQYRLPIPVRRVPLSQRPARPAPPPVTPTGSGPHTSTPPQRKPGRPRQLSLNLYPPQPDPDPYRHATVLPDGQYRLPIPVGRRARPPAPAAPPPQPQPPTPQRGRQLHLPLPDLPVKRRTRRIPPTRGT